MEVKEAMQVIHKELMKQGTLYEGFLASIESSLREQSGELDEYEPHWLAKNILDRMIGDE